MKAGKRLMELEDKEVTDCLDSCTTSDCTYGIR